MLDNDQFERISISIPFLQNTTPLIKREFLDFAYYVKIPTGRQIFYTALERESLVS